MERLRRTLLWHRVDESPGAEYFALRQDDRGWHLEGTAVVALAGQPIRAGYRIDCDEHWQTRSVAVEVAHGESRQTLRLMVDEEQRWWRDGEQISALRGCIDVDLGVTPATNTLPIRRLGLLVGGSEEIVAAWILFPDLRIVASPQRYSRLASDRYRYESGTYQAELAVDELGLVRRYAGAWDCVGVVDPPSKQEEQP